MVLVLLTKHPMYYFVLERNQLWKSAEYTKTMANGSDKQYTTTVNCFIDGKHSSCMRYMALPWWQTFNMKTARNDLIKSALCSAVPLDGFMLARFQLTEWCFRLTAHDKCRAIKQYAHSPHFDVFDNRINVQMKYSLTHTHSSGNWWSEGKMKCEAVDNATEFAWNHYFLSFSYLFLSARKFVTVTSKCLQPYTTIIPTFPDLKRQQNIYRYKQKLIKINVNDMETLWIEILLKSVFSHTASKNSLHRPQAIALSTVPLRSFSRITGNNKFTGAIHWNQPSSLFSILWLNFRHHHHPLRF